ncbi:hypothetical protein EV175_001291 [Coemansia sp. RSA 1933]|nr:hypothetical protein EV175_001291 [Coemansia sp. RSA 1933]
MVSEVDQLLSQIRNETASELLESNNSSSKHGLSVGMQPIDEAIAEAGRHNASAVIECLGLPGSGKTQIVWHICATAAMPRIVRRTDGGDAALNGAGKHVLLMDVDGRADPCDLARHMEGIYRKAIGDGPLADESDKAAECATRAAVSEALEHVHVFTPSSTDALVATLCLVPKYLADRKITERVVLVIDGLGNNYGFERKEASYVRRASRNATPWFRMQQVLVDVIQRVHQQFSCLTVATGLLMLPVSDLASAASGPGGEGSQQRVIRVEQGEFRDHMIPRWLNVVTRSFVLENTTGRDSRGPHVATAISVTPLDKRTHLKLEDKRLAVCVGDHGLQFS